MTDPLRPPHPVLPPSARRPGAAAVLDEHASAHDTDLESYAWLAGVQPYRRPGPKLPWTGWTLLPRARAGRLKRRRLDPDEAVALDALIGSGLLTDDGRLSETGRPLAETLATIDARLRVDATAEGRQHGMEILMVRTTAVVLTTSPPPTPPDDVQDLSLLVLDTVEVEWVPAAIASWTGTAPAWTFAVSPTIIDRALFEQRVDGRPVPLPPQADDHLAAVWAEPWCLWGLGSADSEQALCVLRAGARGSYQVIATPGAATVELRPLPSYTLWHALLQIVQAVVG